MIDYETVERLFRRCEGLSLLVAIDGRPTSGKSALACRLAERFSCTMLPYDDFFRSKEEWRDAAPAFPFPFFRHDEFAAAVHSLTAIGSCAYYPFDWEASAISPLARSVVWSGPIIVEGCGVLDPALAPLYHIRFFVESDAASTFDAAMVRDGPIWAKEWLTMFLPSTELYMATDPRSRADHIVSGRGA